MPHLRRNTVTEGTERTDIRLMMIWNNVCTWKNQQITFFFHPIVSFLMNVNLQDNNYGSPCFTPLTNCQKVFQTGLDKSLHKSPADDSHNRARGPAKPHEDHVKRDLFHPSPCSQCLLRTGKGSVDRDTQRETPDDGGQLDFVGGGRIAHIVFRNEGSTVAHLDWLCGSVFFRRCQSPKGKGAAVGEVERVNVQYVR